MKITDIKTFNVYTYRTNYVFVKIETCLLYTSDAADEL